MSGMCVLNEHGSCQLSGCQCPCGHNDVMERIVVGAVYRNTELLSEETDAAVIAARMDTLVDTLARGMVYMFLSSWFPKVFSCNYPPDHDPINDDFIFHPDQIKAAFPHCDSNVLHSPRACVFCDERPDLQDYRMQNRILFTDDILNTVTERGYTTEQYGWTQCPAWVERGSACQKWEGNVPSPPTRTGLYIQKSPGYYYDD
jgi:hypothetical protein